MKHPIIGVKDSKCCKVDLASVGLEDGPRNGPREHIGCGGTNRRELPDRVSKGPGPTAAANTVSPSRVVWAG